MAAVRHKTERVAMFLYRYRDHLISGDFYSLSSSKPGHKCANRQSWVVERRKIPGHWETMPGRHLTMAMARAEIDRMIEEDE